MTRIAAPAVMLVTDRRRLAPEARTLADELTALERWLDDAIDARVDLIEIRERDLDAQPLQALARRVVARAAGAPTRVLINDRADIARAAGAHGVHLRGDSAPVARVRALDQTWTLGRSIHARHELAQAAGADYVLLGTMFETASKPAVAPQTLDTLRALAREATMPVLVIGGVTPARAAACARAGAQGVGAIGAFLPPGRAAEALGPAEAVRAFRAAWMGGAGVRAPIC